MKAKFTYWRESDGKYLGYLNDYPDHWTQGDDLDDLKKHLRESGKKRNLKSRETPRSCYGARESRVPLVAPRILPRYLSQSRNGKITTGSKSPGNQ
jgi:hypothetical protein